MKTQPNPNPKPERADLLEMVFRNRNRQYGAYPLRKAMPRRLLASFLIAATLMVVGVELPRIVARFDAGETTVVIPERALADTITLQIATDELMLPPPPVAPEAPAEPEPPREVTAPEPPAAAAPLIQTEAYVPPEVVPDHVAPPTPPAALDVPTDPNVAVGSRDYAGDPGGVAGGKPGGTGESVAPGATANGDGNGAIDWSAADQRVAPLNFQDFVNSIRYPAAAREAGVKGAVTLRLLVNEQGTIVEHHVLQSSHPMLTRAVTERLERLRFTKATQGGRAVRYWVVLPVRFNLN